MHCGLELVQPLPAPRVQQLIDGSPARCKALRPCSSSCTAQSGRWGGRTPEQAKLENGVDGWADLGSALPLSRTDIELVFSIGVLRPVCCSWAGPASPATCRLRPLRASSEACGTSLKPDPAHRQCLVALATCVHSLMCREL